MSGTLKRSFLIGGLVTGGLIIASLLIAGLDLLNSGDNEGVVEMPPLAPRASEIALSGFVIVSLFLLATLVTYFILKRKGK